MASVVTERVIGTPTPSVSSDLVEGVSPGQAVKSPCRVATTANITLSSLQTIDAISVVADDRVLVKNQTDLKENGIYKASTGTWARTKDFDGSKDVVKGTFVSVTSGTVGSLANGIFKITTDNDVKIGTDNITIVPSTVTLAFGNAREFNYYDYVDSTQIDFIRAQNTASQNATLVTAGLQAMHNAMMAYTETGGDQPVVGYYDGAFAINGELFDETFAENLWNKASTKSTFSFVGKGIATFRCKGWPSHKAVRTSGWYSDQTITEAVPQVMFRWEQQSLRQFGPRIYDIILEGEQATTDPIGFRGRNLNIFYHHNFQQINLANIGFMIDHINNGRGYNAIRTKCGWQPTAAGVTGFISSTVTFNATASGGTTLVAASEDTFLAGHVGEAFMIQDAGGNGESFSGSISVFTDTKNVILSTANPSDQTGKAGTFLCLEGSITQDTDQLVLNQPITTDLAGRYVMVYKAGSKLYTDQDLLVTRIKTHDPDNVTLTLASQALFTATNTQITFGVSKFIGNSDDQYTAPSVPEGGNNNDYHEFGDRTTFSFDATRGSAVQVVYQNCLDVYCRSFKYHGTDAAFNNFGSNWTSVIYDDCKNLEHAGFMQTHGLWHPTRGAQVVCGNRTNLLLSGKMGTNDAANLSALLYIDPKTATVAKCQIGWRNYLNNPSWPTSGSQKTFRYGTNGSIANLYSLGTSTQRNVAGYRDTPPIRGTSASLDDGFLETGQTSTLTDDTAITITIPKNIAVIKIWSDTANVGCVIGYNAKVSALISFLVLGSDTETVLNTSLSGTTGTDVKVTVAVNQNVIMFENRMGATVEISWSFEG